MKQIFFLSGIILLTMPCSAQAFFQPGALEKPGITLDPPSQEGLAEEFWKVEQDILLYHFEHGEGCPVLVIHGGPGIPPYQPWPGLKEIDQRYKFYYYHQRGCGKSTKPVDLFKSKNYFQNMQTLNKDLGMSTQLADIERIRIILKQDKLILIGHSFGGFIAVLYAIEFPGHIHKMILISPAGMLVFPPSNGGMDQVREYLTGEMQEEYDAFKARYFDYGRIFNKSEEELAILNAEYNRFYVAALQRKGITLSKELIQVKGNGGWSVHALYFSLGQSYAELLPDGKLEVMKEVSHFAF